MNFGLGIGLAMLTVAAVFAGMVPAASAYGYCTFDNDPGQPGGGTYCVRTFDEDCWAYFALSEDSDGEGYTGVACPNDTYLR